MRHPQILILALALSSSALGSTINTIQNGGFESGLTDWSSQFRVFNSAAGTCNDEFAAQTTGAGCAASPTSPDGTMAAYSSSTIAAGDSTEFIDDLSQSFTVPEDVISASITFAETFTLTGSEPGGALIVGLYDGTSVTNNNDFINNDYPVGYNQDISSPWTNESWDVTSILAPYAGQTVTLDLRTEAFGLGTAVTMAGAFDNVAATFTIAPEPATWFMAIAGLGLAFMGRIRTPRGPGSGRSARL